MSPPIVWNPDPIIIGSLLIYLGIYLWRWIRVRKESGARGAPVWRLGAFTLGILTLAAALLTPIDTLGEQLLFMHMVQHMLLLDVAAVLLILGFTKLILRPVTKRLMALEKAVGVFGSPVAALIFYVAVIWFWHIPALYDLAATNPFWHLVEHFCFFSAGLIYWWHLLSPIRSRFQFGGMRQPLYMVASKLLVGALGVLLAFAPYALYPYYANQPNYWGIDATTDQNIAGLVMALEQSLIMGIALAVLLIRAIERSEREQRRSERLEESHCGG